MSRIVFIIQVRVFFVQRKVLFAGLTLLGGIKQMVFVIVLTAQFFLFCGNHLIILARQVGLTVSIKSRELWFAEPTLYRCAFMLLQNI